MTTLAPKTQVGPYEIVSPIGKGGMGEVYKARDTRLDRTVALKVSNSEYGERFEREARAVASLNHPNICTLYDVGPNYLVMEYIDGTPLKGPFSVAAVLPYALQICDALAAAHEKGITHRDLKPANILLTKSGIKLLDFGLAKVEVRCESDETGTHTQSGMILGTPSYMSPEQAQGRPVDMRSDIFSFGSLLYELLTGRKAFEGPTVNCILMSILGDEPAPLKSAPEVQRVIARCLRKHAADRYQSATDLRAALEDCSLQNPAGTPRWSSSAIWVCVLAFFLFAGVAAWRYASGNAGSKEPAIHPITATLAENRVTSASVSSDGSRLAYAELGGSLIVQDLKSTGRRLLRAPEQTLIDSISWIGSTDKILISGETEAGTRTLWVENLSDSQLYSVRRNAQRGIASPDGQLIAFTSGDDTEIWIMNADGGNARKLVIGGSTDSFPFVAFSSDSRRLSYQRRHFTADSVERHTRGDGENNFRRTFETVDLSGRILDAADLVMTSACFLGDGRILFLQPEEKNSHNSNVWELQTDHKTGKFRGRPRRLTQWPEKSLAGISCSADGKFIGSLIQGSQSDIYVAESMGGSLQAVRRLTQEDMVEYPHAWTLDSRAVIFEKPGETGWDLYIQGIDERLAYPLATEDGSKIMPQLSPDGGWVLYSSFRDGSAAARADQKLMRVPIGGGPPQLVPTGPFDEFRCALTPGKRCILRTIQNRQYVYWDLDPVSGRGKELARTAWTPSILGDWALSADGAEAAMPNHDARQARVLLIDLDAPAGHVQSTRELQVPGLGGLIGLIAEAKGDGWFASATSSRGVKLLHIDRNGRFQLLRECPSSTWVVPSPNGQRLAFVDQAAFSNFWSMKLF